MKSNRICIVNAQNAKYITYIIYLYKSNQHNWMALLSSEQPTHQHVSFITFVYHNIPQNRTDSITVRSAQSKAMESI